MLSKNIWHRVLYIVTGLVTFVILSLIFWVIPHVIKDTFPGAAPESAVPAFRIVIVIHLLPLIALVWATIVSHRGHFLSIVNKIGLILSGVVLIVIGLVLIDAAASFLGHLQDMRSTAILLFICVGCDIVTGIIALFIPFKLKNN
jgi:hypothetical protein